MKINQSLVTQTFQCRNNTSGLYHELKDVHHIQDVLKRGLGVTISESESIDFWHWRCNEWDGSWFGIDSSHTNDSDIIEWFQEFIKFVGVKDDKDAEDYFDSQQKIGVKVVVKDAEGAPWEIELDPDYHSQLIRDIESQIPEKSVAGTIRYSLEYEEAVIMTLEQLGRDPRGEVSSQAVIKSGKNRGFRRKETAGTWILAGGFCYESRQESKWPHYSWRAALHRLGFRVGILDREGTRDFFIFMTPASACKTHTNAV